MLSPTGFAAPEKRRISVDEYKDKMKAGWIGQMVGVGWGGPTEFRWQGEIIPEDQMPAWEPTLVNQFGQDDIYVEMTFMRSLELCGLDVDIRQAGIDFANSEYALWHANRYGRENLRKGIAPPDSSHPQFNAHADDIDYQIEADFSGLIAPGMPNVAIQLGEVFGRLMNYGDGLYGGQFVGGMYAEAFFETDIQKIVEAGLKCIPAQSQYAECIRDVIQWYKEEPKDWQKSWAKIEEKYQDNPDYRKFSCSGTEPFNIDAKINGAYIVMGLLYGEGDIDQTILISTRCGQDSDCNPSNAAGILCTTLGFSNLPDRFTSALDESKHFSHTAYNFDLLIKVSEKLVRDAVLKFGGEIETDTDGKEWYIIPVQEPQPSEFVQCWEPGPIANSRFTPEEMEKIAAGKAKDLTEAMQTFAPGWACKDCGEDMDPGMKDEALGKQTVLLTHPLDEEKPCILTKKVEIPEDNKTTLHLTVGHHPEGDWQLIVKADGEALFNESIGGEEAWRDVAVDLSAFAGKTITLDLLNQPTGWRFEGGYWARIELRSE
jgi:hypothetical protein